MSGAPVGRFPEVDLETASALQRQFADEIRSGPRKAIIGPFIPLLHAPELARRIQKVGEYLRFESSLPKDVLECAVLVVAIRWESRFEWMVHSKLAREREVPSQVIDAIEAGTDAIDLPQPYRLVVDLCRRALISGDIGQIFFDDARNLFGLDGVLELLTVCGYYSTLAMYLNTAQIQD